MADFNAKLKATSQEHVLDFKQSLIKKCVKLLHGYVDTIVLLHIFVSIVYCCLTVMLNAVLY